MKNIQVSGEQDIRLPPKYKCKLQNYQCKVSSILIAN